MRDREKDEKTQEQEEYLALQAEWIENVGGLRKGDHLLVLDHPTVSMGGWESPYATPATVHAEWTGRTVQCDRIAEQNGIKCHSFGQFVWLPFFVLSKQERK